MKDLIEALNIFLKYGDVKYPFHCEHDVLYVKYDSSIVSEEDKKRLDELGFFCVDDDGELLESNGFASYRYGSC